MEHFLWRKVVGLCQTIYAENPSNSSLNQPWNGFLSLRKTAARVLACNRGKLRIRYPGLPEGAMVEISVAIRTIMGQQIKEFVKYVVGNGTHEEARR